MASHDHEEALKVLGVSLGQAAQAGEAAVDGLQRLQSRRRCRRRRRRHRTLLLLFVVVGDRLQENEQSRAEVVGRVQAALRDDPRKISCRVSNHPRRAALSPFVFGVSLSSSVVVTRAAFVVEGG